ncbi:MAG: aminomethyl transferase family protein [Bdellovibrio sp.]|nr:MAG: aminomethyl transferase family protein [Bdellovibrio sp.]
MPIPTPFHSKTSALCQSFRWKDWAGFAAVCSYDSCHEKEYFALRHAVGLIDVSPLFKYEITGKDAGRFLSFLTVKDVEKLKINQVTYLCWCDDNGHIIDDGTVVRLDEHRYRLTSAEPSFSWMSRYNFGFDITIQDVTDSLCALAVQGPLSRALLNDVFETTLLDNLRFFQGASLQKPFELYITRTGYTGDLGFEIWTASKNATKLWDLIFSKGSKYDLTPTGLDALDMARIEAGFIMNGVDYFSAHHCLIDSRKSTPFELGLGWCVQLHRETFVGKKALLQEKQRGPQYQLIGLITNWDHLEKLYQPYGIPPQLPHGAWRTPIPIYNLSKEQVGYATSGTWSPLLKQNLALATIQPEYAEPGTELLMEVTVEFERKQCLCKTSPLPFYNPPHKRSLPSS